MKDSPMGLSFNTLFFEILNGLSDIIKIRQISRRVIANIIFIP